MVYRTAQDVVMAALAHSASYGVPERARRCDGHPRHTSGGWTNVGEMGHSRVSLCYHITFATKHRLPVIDVGIEQHVWRILRDVCEELGCHVYAVGGYEDHVHVAVFIPAAMSVAEFMRKLKCISSRSIQREISSLKGFRWQVGYGATTFAYRDVAAVVCYIKHQRQHHETGN